MRVLVTGATGFAGRHLLQHLLDQGDEVLATAVEPSVGETLPAGVKYKPLNIAERSECERIVGEYAPEGLVHLAGMAFVPDAERDFRKALEINVEGADNVLAACREVNPKTRVVVVSSSEVFGKLTGAELPLTEATPIAPAHNYGVTKAALELLANRYLIRKELDVVVARSFNHIGPGQRPDFVVSSFAKQLAQIDLSLTPPEIRVGNLKALRDFTDVRDIVRGYRLALTKGSGTYNLCSGRAVSIESILKTLLALTEVSVEVQEDPNRMRPSEVPEIRGSFARAEADLGWRPLIELEQSLTDVFEYWRGELSQA